MYQLAENLIHYKAYTIGENISYKEKYYYTTLLIGHLKNFGTLKELKGLQSKRPRNENMDTGESPQGEITKF